MAPFDLAQNVSTAVFYMIYLAIGMGFGAVLEMSGFGDSRKLAAQFYLKDMTVLKVMFTGIIVASTLIFLSTSLGLLDYDRVWVNPTYLWPGIMGGLIMGVGFVIGGFCPGTSLVASSTLKIDGIFFVFGVAFGIFLFGETVGSFHSFADSSFMGRFTLPEGLGLPTGVVLILLILMALLMFWGGEISERFFGSKMAWKDIPLLPENRRKAAAAGLLVLAVLIVAAIGQLGPEDRFARMADQERPKLENRDVYIHPGEVVELMQNAAMRTTILDIRKESDFNLFHVLGALNIPPERLDDPVLIGDLKNAPANTVTFVMSNGERDSTAAYKYLRGAGVINLYIVEGGVNKWLDVYKIDPCIAVARPDADEARPERLRYAFLQAVGARSYSSHPGCACKEFPTDCFMATHKATHARPTVTHDPAIPKVEYTRKVKIARKKKPQGGCG